MAPSNARNESEVVRFPLAADPAVVPWSRLFGVNDRTGYLEVGDLVTARFGPWCVTTPIDNIAHVEITGPYAWWKVAGPARYGLSDHSLTFATTTQHGVELTFRDPVPGLTPFAAIRHPTLTVTVEDPETCVSVLVLASGRITGAEDEVLDEGNAG